GWARVGTIAAAALLLCGLGAAVVASGGFHAADVEIVVNRGWLEWAHGYDHLYAKPWMRAGPLLAGVAAAQVYRLPRALEALGRWRILSFLGLLAAIAAGAAATHWPLAEGAPRPVEVAYLAGFRTVFGIAVAYLVLFSLSRHPVGAAIGRVLSTRLLYP